MPKESAFISANRAVVLNSFSVCGVNDTPTTCGFDIGYFIGRYDFYRLSDPGIMQEDLSEAINSDNAIVVVEWADSVADFLPATRQTIKISYREDGSREVIL